MIKVMQISDIVELPNKGFSLVGGNPELTIERSTEIKGLVGKQIVVKTTESQELIFNVANVNISFSISGHLLIGISIGYPQEVSKVKKGLTIYVKTDTNQ